MTVWMKPALFAILATAGFIALQQGVVETVTARDSLLQIVNQQELPGLILITLLGMTYCALGAPRQALAFTFGFAMGPISGAVFSTILCTGGAALCYGSARYLLRPGMHAGLQHRMECLERLTAKGTLVKVLLLRLTPVGSNLLVNLGAGVSGVRVLPFLAGSMLGYLPQMIIFSLAGAGAGSVNATALALGTGLFILITLLGTVLYQRGLAPMLKNNSPARQ